MWVYLNNRFVKDRDAKVSVFDRGFLYGDGVFETVRAYHGTLFRLEDHLRRLEQSARLIGLALPIKRAGLERIAYRALARNRLKQAILRITVSRGVGPLQPERNRRRPTLVVTARPLPDYPPSLYRKGAAVILSSVRRNLPEALDPRIKSANFLNNLLALREAQARGAVEAILLNHRGELTEGSVTNLFFIHRGVIHTPSIEVGILPGVTRQAVLELAKAMRLTTRTGFYKPDHLYHSRECFLTNTSLELLPVVRVNHRTVGTGRPGPLTRRLQEAFRKMVEEETYG
jgi:branched-chain amino acid aminotransferase